MIDTDKYIQACNSDFWQKIFRVELKYLLQHLEGCSDILSVGCGQAIIESGLSEYGFNITGLDVSNEALNCAPDSIRTIAARAEDMDFPESSFDAAIYITSLQFIADYKKSIEKTYCSLRPAGKLVVMLLNPESDFFKRKMLKQDSYVQNLKHSDLKNIESYIAGLFNIQTEYYLGIRGEDILDTSEISVAALYIIRGRKR